MRRVRKGGKRKVSFSFLLIVFFIAFILLAFVYFFIFSIVGKSDFWQVINGQKNGADVEKFDEEIGSTLADGGHFIPIIRGRA